MKKYIVMLILLIAIALAVVAVMFYRARSIEEEFETTNFLENRVVKV